MKKLLNSVSIIVLGLTLMLAGCAEPDEEEGVIGNEDPQMTQDTDMSQDTTDRMAQDTTMKYSKAIAVLNPTEGNKAEGTVTFEKVSDGVRVEGKISGLTPGLHGFHVHENGDCSAPDATSAGGHFNPGNNEHGARTDSVRHMGDLGNIEAESNGNTSVSFTDSVLVLNQIMGKAVIVHSGEDDFTSQPSGAAGARLACGVIESASADTTMQQGESNIN